MNCRKSLLLMAVLLTGWSLRAQSPQPLTLDDVIPGGRTWWDHQPEMPRVMGVIPEGALIYEGDRIVAKNGNNTTPILTSAEWQAMSGSSLQSLPATYPVGSGSYLQATVGDDIYFIDYRSKKLVSHYTISRQTYGEVHPSPNADYLMLTDEYNLYIAKPGDTEPRAIADDASPDIVYGQAAHRSEFGIDGGVFFSPSGRYVAFYRIDQSNVSPYPIVRMEDPIAKHSPIKYPMAGRASQHVTIGIYDTATGKTTYLETGAPEDRYFTNLSWTPDEKYLYIDEVSRDQETCQLKRYNISTGLSEATVLTESNERYIEPQRKIEFVPTRPNLFVRLSRVNGFDHLYLYNTSGELVRRLTDGEWEVMEFWGIDPAGKYAYFSANKEHPTQSDLYRVLLKNGRLERLTTGDGTHSVQLSNDYSLAYDAFSSISVPGIATVLELGKKVKAHVLQSCDLPRDLYMRPVVELGSIKAADGVTDLYYKITRPNSLEKGRRYPVIVYVYGGPHAQLVTNSWRSLRYNWDTYMAEQGYVVFTLDNRGSANRGHAFESVIHRQLGVCEMADQMKGVEYLASLPYTDMDRLGVHGWSFGGFMTTNLMLSHNDAFKVGVAGGPVMDWRYYEVMYGERYMDTPDENPEGYAQSDLTTRAQDLKGRLLLIHGAVDPVVVWQNSQDFVNNAIKSRVLTDYMIYPGHEHNVIGPDRVHLYMTITRYFNDFL